MDRLWQGISRPSITSRLLLIAGTPLVCLLGFVGLSVMTSYDRTWDARIDELRAICEQAVSISADFQRRVQAGSLTQEQAIAQYRDAIRPIRYDGGAGSYFVYGMDGDALVPGPTQAAKDANRVAITDADGKLTVRAMIEAASHGGGSVVYRSTKPGSAVAQPKLAYVMPLPGWNIFVATAVDIDDLNAAATASIVRYGALVAVLFALCIAVAWLVSRGISRALARLRLAMEALANGDLSIAITGIDRGDEIGAIAGVVLVLKEGMAKAKQFAGDQALQHQLAATEKHAALADMADAIEAKTSAALRQVSLRTAAMTETADDMAALASRTSESAQSAANASALASANVQTAAEAAEQLSASIREIRSQVVHASDVAGRAVAAGSETRSTIEALNNEVKQIGAVADLIGAIAAKTNLLALNATIEAARAGDFGKGFAVVASEVKALATQTAHSTREIAHHISQIRGATGASVAAVIRIEQTIEEINAVAGSIAAAVEQQGTTTAAIAQKVAETASAANEANTRTTEVLADAEQAGIHAGDVRDNATALNTAVGDLHHAVTHVVRTATPEVDRRSARRHQVDLPGRLSVHGNTHDVLIVDLSDTGAQVRGAPPLPENERGSLAIQGIGLSLPFVAKHVEGDALHMAFALDAATAASFAGTAERLATRHAA